MIQLLRARLRQGHRTIRYPAAPPPELPERFRGHPVLDPRRCADGCRSCTEACPTGAIALEPRLSVDLGRCLFCNECAEACPTGAISYGRDHRLAARTRDDLLVEEARAVRLAAALDEKARGLFGRSLELRQVSAGGCNGCEVEVNVLGTVVFDLGRFGVRIVASPRHADGLIVTGPVTENMRLALRKTWDAVAPPKIVIAVGACAISGGPYAGHPEVHDGVAGTVPVDLFVPGCPPHPLTILDGLLRLLGRLEEEGGRGRVIRGSRGAHGARGERP
jgi:Ni,Fe-hydrogenase III small subunit/NAD-dependent dihydropyrimidine dehydrogenase PreA subunit